jgi:threonine aldolase
MKEGTINLYSDTQTRPTAAMRRAMAEAEVGDEQQGLDPTVNRLCGQVAQILGKEAAVFLPSGTMCNAISILVHCRAGDEIYADHTAHIIHFEAGEAAALAGAAIHPLDGERGIYTAEILRAALRDESRYGPRPRLVEIEQTSNLGGGAVWPLGGIQEVAEVARSRGLALHMDGARLLNAVVASGVRAEQFAEPFDSVWIDLSKGLGCPVGAVLAGPRGFIEEAWRWKQRLGGAMRQAGILAAAGLYALEHHVDRLAEDHENARRFGEMVSRCEGVEVVHGMVETNIVFVDVSGAGVDAYDVSDNLEARGINVGAFDGATLRAVTHLDVSSAQAEEAGRAFVEVVQELGRSCV